MQNLQEKKVAIVCDWIKDWGGAELVLEQLLEMFPQADIYTSIFFQEKNPIFTGRKIYTSFIQNIPIINRSHKVALLLRPQAFESFDFSQYDIVISSSSAESKGIITKPDTLHICYCHTPTRYFWSHFHEYMNMMEFGILNPIARFCMPKIIHKLRNWDFVAAQRPDYYIANSYNTSARIQKYYKRDSEVIHPCIQSDFQDQFFQRKDYYISVGRCIPYKKFDLLVETFNKNKKPLILVTNTDNSLYRKLKKESGENITWVFNPSRKELEKLYGEAQCFVFPPEEDFGLVPIEAMSLGTPVLAFGKGGALETVVSGKTGMFFSEQTEPSLNSAISEFEEKTFDYNAIQEHAKQFSHIHFKEQFLEYIKNRLS